MKENNKLSEETNKEIEKDRILFYLNTKYKKPEHHEGFDAECKFCAEDIGYNKAK